MPKKRHKPEEIVAKLRQVDVLVSQGQNQADAVRSTARTMTAPTPLPGTPTSTLRDRSFILRFAVQNT